LDKDLSSPPCSLVETFDGSIRLYGLINRPVVFTDPDNPQREINDPEVLNKFALVLDQICPDIVHYHNFHGLTLALAKETFRRQIPSCYTPHNFHMIDPELYLLKNGLERWDNVDTIRQSETVARNPHLREWYCQRIKTTLQLMNKWVNMTLSVSSRQKELLVSYGADPNRIAIVHQASSVSDELWQNPIVASECSRMVTLPLRVGYIGGVIPIKGVQMLVSAAQSFTPAKLQIHLYGFTNPTYEESLRLSDAKGMVTFHGPYKPAELSKIACEIDIAVLPTLVEDCAPLTLLELHAMRLPVIASRIGGIPDFITNGIDGYLYDPYDFQKLVAIIRSILEQPGLLVQMRKSLTAPTHTFANYLDHLEEIYTTLISGKTPDVEKLSLITEQRERSSDVITKSCQISLNGGLFANNSLAHVNRELFLQLLDKGYIISYIPTEPDDFTSSVDPRFERLEAIRNLPLDRVDITIRHQWPPDFTPPPSGKLVLIQPWEFGSLPKEWIPHFTNTVDEVWVPSNYVRECYISSGVPQEKVQVVPNGVDTATLTPDATPLQLRTAKNFRFLFVGGTIQRKGIDLLLGAYFHNFRVADNVCLVIKDMGGATVYEGQTAQDVIERFQQQQGAPEIEYIDRILTPLEMAGLYTACQCLVHPYRGEGFGLPIAEAMACGLAPIVTGYGAALDFCTQENSWLIPASVEKLPCKQVGNRETVDYPWVAEPDFNELCNLMRHAAMFPDEVASRGRIASHDIRLHFTWEQAARKAEERLQALVSQPATPLKTTTRSVFNEETTLRKRLVDEACAMARKQAMRGDLDGAVKTLLNQGIKVNQYTPIPYVELAEILMAAGRYDEALQVLPEMPPTTNPILIREFESVCLCALGNDTAARQAADQAAGSPRAQVVLGTLEMRQGNMPEAELFFRQAIETDPSCGSGWLSLGMMLWGQGKQEQAWQAMKRSVEVDPLNDNAVNILRDIAKRLDMGNDRSS
jgi:glycosyltransferase involved in cell wall biosynthesis